MRLGPNQLLTLNTTLHGASMMRTLDMIIDSCTGGTGGAGGPSHGQGLGGQGGRGEAPTVNYNFSLEQTIDLTSKLNYAKDAGVQASKACLQGTRVELLTRIREWALHPAERTLLLYGAAGTGKSAIVHTIARGLRSENLALVPFFAFNRSVPNRSSSQLIPTWAKELAQLHTPYQAYLHGLRLSNLESRDLVHQQDVLLLKGLHSLTSSIKSVVFIIDALDECPQNEVHELYSVLERLCGMDGLPPSIRKALLRDIRKFVKDKLRNTKFEYLVPDVARMAQTLFECAAVLCRELTPPRIMLPSTQTKIIKTLQGGQITSLYKLYETILDIHFEEDDAIKVFQQVMSWVFTVRTPQTRRVLAEIASAVLPEESKLDSDHILTWLGSLLSGTTSHNEPISPLHTSLQDFLVDETKSHKFWVKLGPHCHQEISVACLKIMNHGLRFNICGLQTSFALNSEVEDLSGRVKEFAWGQGEMDLEQFCLSFLNGPRLRSDFVKAI
ncbi:hypothetical protein B0H14DRAFT_2568069 [Mycena olivaceomarginata]|nr:hypothetical protein B0H14DRAFT_2568069 [Mycena olivaceomarginata]